MIDDYKYNIGELVYIKTKNTIIKGIIIKMESFTYGEFSILGNFYSIDIKDGFYLESLLISKFRYRNERLKKILG